MADTLSFINSSLRQVTIQVGEILQVNNLVSQVRVHRPPPTPATPLPRLPSLSTVSYLRLTPRRLTTPWSAPQVIQDP